MKAAFSMTLRLRVWLVVIVVAAGILMHRPLIGIVIAILLALSALTNYLIRRKQRRDA
jgi:hypothetical protein